jgi:hypothetical protein
VQNRWSIGKGNGISVEEFYTCDSGRRSKFMTVDGTLMMRIKFELFPKTAKSFVTGIKTCSGRNSDLKKKLLSDLNSIYETGSDADLTIYSKDGKATKAHKTVLSGKYLTRLNT